MDTRGQVGKLVEKSRIDSDSRLCENAGTAAGVYGHIGIKVANDDIGYGSTV